MTAPIPQHPPSDTDVSEMVARLTHLSEQSGLSEKLHAGTGDGNLFADLREATSQAAAMLSRLSEDRLRRERDWDAACDEARRDGYDEGQSDANDAHAEIVHAVLAWGRRRDLFQLADYPDGYTAQDVVDALGDHERECISAANARAERAEAERDALKAFSDEAIAEHLRAVEHLRSWADYAPNGRTPETEAVIFMAGELQRKHASLTPKEP